MLSIIDLDERDEATKLRVWYRQLFDEAFGKYLALSRSPMVRAHNLELLAQGLDQQTAGDVRDRENLMLWLADFQIAGLETLHARELGVWNYYFIGQWTKRQTIALVHLSGQSAFEDLANIVREKIGGEIARRKLWPLHNQAGTGYLD